MKKNIKEAKILIFIREKKLETCAWIILHSRLPGYVIFLGYITLQLTEVYTHRHRSHCI
jgi:hypothetical protein